MCWNIDCGYVFEDKFKLEQAAPLVESLKLVEFFIWGAEIGSGWLKTDYLEGKNFWDPPPSSDFGCLDCLYSEKGHYS